MIFNGISKANAAIPWVTSALCSIPRSVVKQSAAELRGRPEWFPEQSPDLHLPTNISERRKICVSTIDHADTKKVASVHSARRQDRGWIAVTNSTLPDQRQLHLPPNAFK